MLFRSAQPQHRQCQEELEAKLRQLHDESRARQAAEQQVNNLCNRLAAQVEKHSETQTLLDTERQMCVVAFAKKCKNGMHAYSTQHAEFDTPTLEIVSALKPEAVQVETEEHQKEVDSLEGFTAAQ